LTVFTAPLARAGGALRGVATGAFRGAFRDILAAFEATRFVTLATRLGTLDAAFRFVAVVAEAFRPDVFLRDVAAERPVAPRDLLRAGFAAFRAVFRVGLRPLERALVRELFRAAFLVPPAALRLAITCSLFGRHFGPRNQRPLTLTVTGK
jgi:hypothetical protein